MVLGGLLGLGFRGLLGRSLTRHRAAHFEVGGPLVRRRLDMAQDRQRDQLVAFGQRDAAHAHRGAPGKYPHVGDGKADALAAGGGQQHVVVLGADLHVDDRLVVVELHGDDAGAPHVDEVGQFVAADVAAGGREHHVEIGPGRFILRQRHDGGDALALLQRQDVDHGLAAAVRRRHRQPPDLFLVDLSARGEEQAPACGSRPRTGG